MSFTDQTFLAITLAPPIHDVTQEVKNDAKTIEIEHDEEDDDNYNESNGQDPKLKKTGKTAKIQKWVRKNILKQPVETLTFTGLGIAAIAAGIYLFCNNGLIDDGLIDDPMPSRPPKPVNLPGDSANRILGFYSDTIKINVGAKHTCSWQNVINILENNGLYNSPFFEESHSWVQWLFPTKRASGYNYDSDTLSNEIILVFKNTAELINRLKITFCLVVQHYYHLDIQIIPGATTDLDKVTISINEPNYNLITRAMLINGKHNLLRITRILESMKTLGLQNYEKAFFTCLSQIHDKEDMKHEIDSCIDPTTGKNSFQIWQEKDTTTIF